MLLTYFLNVFEIVPVAPIITGITFIIIIIIIIIGSNSREDPSVDGRIILRLIFRKWDVGVWTGSSWLRIGTGGEHV